MSLPAGNDDCSDGDGWEVTVTITPPPIAHIVAVLEHFAEGGPLASRAALRRGIAAILKPSPGRASIDDRAALAEARDLLRSGRCKSARQACLAVAKARESGPAIDTMAERLREKIRKDGGNKF